jgi:hypothetical protein
MSEGAVWGGQYSTTRYPIVYRVVTWMRIVSVIATLLLAGGFGILAFQPLWAGWNVPLNPVLVCVDVCLSLLMLYFIWWAFTAQIVLRDDAMELKNPFISRVLRVSDIKGRRYTSQRKQLLIVLKDGNQVTLSVESFGLDARFDEWAIKLPDLKKIDAEEEELRVRNDASLGATPSERLAAHARRKGTFGKLYLSLTFASMALFFVGMLMHATALEPIFFIATTMPWACVVLGYFYKDQLLLAASGNNAAAVVVPMMMPVLVLVVLALSGANMVDGTGVIARGALIGLPLLLALTVLMSNISASASQKLLGFAGLALFACFYGGGVLALGNRVLDKSSPQVFHTQVVGRHLVRGKGGPTHYLELAGWGPEPGGTNLEVDSARYFAAHKGDDVCMGAYPGKFGYQWVHSVSCPTGNSP